MPFTVQAPKGSHGQAMLVGAHAQLKDIRILELQGKVLDPEVADELVPITELKTKATVAVTESNLLYRFGYDFTIKGKGDNDAVHISLEVGALFDVSSASDAEEKFSEEAVTAFGNTTAIMAVYPYVRSCVSDITVRLGCPAATLDLLVLGEGK